jgi:hypothetical protein
MQQSESFFEFHERHTELHPKPYCCRLSCVPSRDGAWVNLSPDNKELDPTIAALSDDALQKLARPDLVYPLVPVVYLRKFGARAFVDAKEQLLKQTPVVASWIPGSFPRPNETTPSLDECIIDGIDQYKQVQGGKEYYFNQVLKANPSKYPPPFMSVERVFIFCCITEQPKLYNSVFGTGTHNNARLLVHTVTELYNSATPATREARRKLLAQSLLFLALHIYSVINARYARYAPSTDSSTRCDSSYPPYICVFFAERDRFLRDGWWKKFKIAMEEYKSWDMADFATKSTFSEFVCTFLLFLYKIAQEERLVLTDEEDDSKGEKKKDGGDDMSDDDEKKKKKKKNTAVLVDKGWPIVPQFIKTYITTSWNQHCQLFLVRGRIRSIPIGNVKEIFDSLAESCMAATGTGSAVSLEVINEVTYPKGFSILGKNKPKVITASTSMAAIRNGTHSNKNWPAFLGLPDLLTSLDMDPSVPGFTVSKIRHSSKTGAIRVTDEARWKLAFLHGGLGSECEEFKDHAMAVKMWVTKHQPSTAIRYRYAMFRAPTGRLCFTPPLHRIYRKGTFLVDETSPVVMSDAEFKWLWTTEYKDARRGAYKIDSINDASSNSGGGDVCIGNKQYLVSTSSASSNDKGSSSSVPQHLLDFVRSVPAAWLLSAATDSGLIAFFPTKDLPPYQEEKKQRSRPGGGDFKGLQEPMWTWSIQCEDSGQAGITRGIFHPQHALRLCWDTYAIYAMACMQSGDEINVVRVLKSKLPQRYESHSVDWQVALRRLQIGCRLWHALVARRTHMTVDQLSSTANDVRKTVQTKLIEQSTITNNLVNDTTVPKKKKKKAKNDDEEDDEEEEKRALNSVLSDFVSQQTTPGHALAIINSALLTKQSSLVLDVEFWKEFVVSYYPEIQDHGQTKSEKNARVVQFARSLASLPSTDKDAMEVEWKEGALELQDWSLEPGGGIDAAYVLLPPQVIPSTETPRSRAFKTVEDAVRYVRRRGFLLCAYPIVLSLGYLFPGEHVKYTNRLEQPATYAYMMKYATPRHVIDKRAFKAAGGSSSNGDGNGANGSNPSSVSIQATVDGMQALVDKNLRLGALFRTYQSQKHRDAAGGDAAVAPLDYDRLAKEVTDAKFIPESKLPFYVGILEALRAKQASLGKRGVETLSKLNDALDNRTGYALLLSEYTKSLRRRIAEGEGITSVCMQRGIAALLMRKGISELQATRVIIDATVDHVISQPEVVQSIMGERSSAVESGSALFEQLQQAIEERVSDKMASDMLLVDDSKKSKNGKQSLIEARQKQRKEQQAMDLSSDGKETKRESAVVRKPTAPSNDPFLEDGDDDDNKVTAAAAAVDNGLDGLIMLSNAITASSSSTPLPPSTSSEEGKTKKNKKKRIRESDDEADECESPTKRTRVEETD